MQKFFSPHFKDNRKIAFTLAEVLITLGIIGVVAAMTLPTITANQRKTEVVTKLKKIYTVVNQAINLSVAEYGDVKGWAADCGNSGNETCSRDEAKEWFNKYIGKHLKILKIEDFTTTSGKEVFNVYLNDGSILMLTRYLYDMTFYINKKAFDNPQSGRNCFAFRFNPILATGQSEDENTYTIKPTFEPYATNWDGTREGLLTDNIHGCAQPSASYCAKLIQFDGWQIKDDYPIKF